MQSLKTEDMLLRRGNSLSGYFGGLGLGEYAARTAKYYWPYVTHPFFHVAFAALIHLVVEMDGRPRRRLAPGGGEPGDIVRSIRLMLAASVLMLIFPVVGMIFRERVW